MFPRSLWCSKRLRRIWRSHNDERCGLGAWSCSKYFWKILKCWILSGVNRIVLSDTRVIFIWTVTWVVSMCAPYSALLGGTHHGFWIRLKQTSEGPSFTTTYCPKNVPLGANSKNNYVRSSGRFGLWIFPTVSSDFDTIANGHIRHVLCIFEWQGRRIRGHVGFPMQF